jgi:hypothetical protein
MGSLLTKSNRKRNAPAGRIEVSGSRDSKSMKMFFLKNGRERNGLSKPTVYREKYSKAADCRPS